MPPNDPQGPAPTPVNPPAPAPAPARAGASSHVDLGNILLPKKETPGQTPQSAQRINAGILFEQEHRAGTEGLTYGTEPPAGAPHPETPGPSAPQAKPQTEASIVKPLQTYQGDIASLVDEKNLSVVSIAAAEADRRGTRLEAREAPLNQPRRSWLRAVLTVGAGLLLIGATAGAGLFIYSRLQPIEPDAKAQAPFIFVDDARTVAVQSGDSRADLMRALVAAKEQVSLSLGLIARLQVVMLAADDSAEEISAPEFLQALAPNVPAELVRTLEPHLLLGVHSYDENQAFMILSVDSYETAYTGLLAWERSIRNDLAPLFTRTPPVRARVLAPATPAIPFSTSSISADPATTTGTSTSTTASTTLPAETRPAPQFVPSNFVDHVVENRDSRAILNEEGEELLLWTFLDRSTVLIATNAATLREVISRLSQANILSLPPPQ